MSLKRQREADGPPPVCTLVMTEAEADAAMSGRGNRIFELYQGQQLCDATVKVGGLTKRVSRLMLSAASPFFAAAFSSQMREGSERTVHIADDVSEQCVEALLRYAHGGGMAPLHVDECELENLARAADRFGFADVLPVTARGLCRTLSLSNVMSRFVLSEQLHLATLTRACVDMIGSCFDSLAPSLPELSHGCLVLLLDHDPMPPALSEVRLYQTLLEWLDRDPPRREELFAPLLKHIRLPHLGSAYLTTNLLYAPRVLASASAQEQVREAVVFLSASVKDRQSMASPTTARRRHGVEIVESDQIEVSGRTLLCGPQSFRALPDDADPLGEMEQQSQEAFIVPSGWQVVCASDPDFKLVRTRIIAAYTWSTHAMFVRRSPGHGFAAFCAKGFESPAPGEEYDGYDEEEDGTIIQLEAPESYRLTSSAYRLLIRKSA